MNEPKYKRILLKLSGEQLAGEHGSGIDAKTVSYIAKEVKTAVDAGVEVAIMVGGGNYVRGAQIAGNGIRLITGHYMGMLGTMINGLALADLFNEAGVSAHLLSNIWSEQVADPFTQRRALHHLAKGRVVIVGGGTGRPYVTTDTAAVSLALELNCDLVCKLTKVDGVYNKDPIKFPDAVKYDKMTFAEALENPEVKVMDKAALGLALEQNKQILVFDFHQTGNVLKVIYGEPVGTLIS